MFTLIIFIIVLGVLVLVHELGHFMMAKQAGMKVEEFGIGFPPRLFSIKRGGTTYSFNIIPFGGFVRILGEDGDNKTNPDSFGSKSGFRRGGVIVAGVIMNLILAFVLYTTVNSIGTLKAIDESNIAYASDLKVQIEFLEADSPAALAGARLLDEIVSVRDEEGNMPEIFAVDDIREFTSNRQGQLIFLEVRAADPFSTDISPGQVRTLEMTGRVNPEPGTGIIGVGMIETGQVNYPLSRAIIVGLKDTIDMTQAIIGGFVMILKNLFSDGEVGADLSGPVGIAKYTGQAARFSFSFLLTFVAFMSLNLAILNILPFPALDGGRFLFLIIEKIKGSPLPKKFELVANSVGFFLLIGLLVVVTVKDIAKLI